MRTEAELKTTSCPKQELNRQTVPSLLHKVQVGDGGLL